MRLTAMSLKHIARQKTCTLQNYEKVRNLSHSILPEKSLCQDTAFYSGLQVAYGHMDAFLNALYSPAMEWSLLQSGSDTAKAWICQVLLCHVHKCIITRLSLCMFNRMNHLYPAYLSLAPIMQILSNSLWEKANTENINYSQVNWRAPAELIFWTRIDTPN